MFQLSNQVTFYGLLFDLGWLLIGYTEDKGIVPFTLIKISKW